MPEKLQKLDPTKILTTTSRHILYDCLLKGMLIKDAAKEAGYSYRYARNLVANGGITALALQTKAELSKKAGITIESLQSNLLEVAQKAYSKGAYSAATAAYTTLLKSIGGFTDNRPNPEAMRGKELDAKKMEDLRRFAELYYGDQYLAKPVEQPNTLDLRPLPAPIVDNHADMGQAGCKDDGQAENGDND